MSTTLHILVSYSPKCRRNFSFEFSSAREALAIVDSLCMLLKAIYPHCRVLRYTINVLNNEIDK